jgi:dTDP-4-dehydrorhamnose 3,5-epimerase
MRLSIPSCEHGIGTIETGRPSKTLIDGVVGCPLAIWPDDRGYFFEVARIGQGPVVAFDALTTQVSATFSFPGTIKAFHYHLFQTDCWVPAAGMIQVALADLRVDSPTFGARNTLYIGVLRPLQLVIPPGVAHGYKVIGRDTASLIYVTSRTYDPADEGRIPYDDPRLDYDWTLQNK